MEISASGYTKAMQKDDELLHPEGPEGAEGQSEDDEDDEDPEEGPSEPVDLGTEEAANLEEYKQAMLELEGLRLDEDTKTSQRDPSKDQPDCDPSQGGPIHKQTDNKAQNQSELERNVDETETRTEALPKELGAGNCTSPRSDEELEAADECPDLVDLSAINKEFKPFRYMDCFIGHLKASAIFFSYNQYCSIQNQWVVFFFFF